MKGKYVFIASAATLLLQVLVGELGVSDEEGGELSDAIKAGSSKTDGNGSDGKDNTKSNAGGVKTGDDEHKTGDSNTMDMDRVEISTPSALSSKQKHLDLLGKDVLSLWSSDIMNTSTSSVGSSEPSSKKHSAKNKQMNSKPSSSVLCKSSSKVAKIMNTTVLHSMQGTMNWVTDILEKSIMQPVDSQSGVQNEALHFL